MCFQAVKTKLSDVSNNQLNKPVSHSDFKNAEMFLESSEQNLAINRIPLLEKLCVKKVWSFIFLTFV